MPNIYIYKYIFNITITFLVATLCFKINLNQIKRVSVCAHQSIFFLPFILFWFEIKMWKVHQKAKRQQKMWYLTKLPKTRPYYLFGAFTIHFNEEKKTVYLKPKLLFRVFWVYRKITIIWYRWDYLFSIAESINQDRQHKRIRTHTLAFQQNNKIGEQIFSPHHSRKWLRKVVFGMEKWNWPKNLSVC